MEIEYWIEQEYHPKIKLAAKIVGKNNNKS